MYKTVTIDVIKNVSERSFAIERVCNEQLSEGWDLVTMISTKNQSTILTFAENPQYKFSKEVNKGITTVKDKISKVVDSIKNKQD